ncbi:MAG: thymidine phosphorylase [Turicibacter sp.]|nr:thymidine phosphorylase [Turicibacter sp.]
MIRMYDIIQKKKEGKALTTEEINAMIDGFTKGEIPNEQMSAFAMAVYFKGMTLEETSALTIAMVHSGDTIDLSGIDGFKVDKHSTGGVGDKTSFILMSIVASLGIKVPKMSGRGLGHTGGTLDKAEAIPGVRIELELDEFQRIVTDTGACLAGQTGELAPADKKLYALRDVTATVDNISLIAASIMSKKIASGADGIVLDVKTGSGAFMKSFEDSLALAQAMVAIGQANGRKMASLITDMNVPTGYSIGNALEIIEVIEVLNGAGPTDLRDLCLELAANMVHLATDTAIEACREQVQTQLESGAAFEKFVEIIAAQGGDVRYLHDVSLFAEAGIKHEIIAPTTGYIAHMNAEGCGLASCMLGAGRQTMDDVIDYRAGIVLKSKTGDFVHAGDVLAIFHTNKADSIASAEELFLKSFEFTTLKADVPPLIYARVTTDSVDILK